MINNSIYFKFYSRKEKFASFFLILGSQNLIFISSTLLLSTLFLFLKLPISFLIVMISLIVSTIWGWWVTNQHFKEENTKIGNIILLSLFFFYIILCFCIFISGSFLDISYDGQTYHQETIFQLMNGWNPIYSDVPSGIDNSIWTNHYARGAEINAAALSEFTGNIEKSKAINLLLIITTFLFATGTIIITSDLPKSKSFLVLGFLISLNPVSICQSLSFCVDGQLASVISCFLCIMLLLPKKADILVLVPLIATLIILINIKFTGLIYALIFSAGLLLWIFIYQKEKFVPILTCLFIGFLAGSLFVGYDPYVTNITDHGNPFYPIIGSDIDVITTNQPVSFQNINRLENLFVSVFSHSRAQIGAYSDFQIPFVFSPGDLVAFCCPDVRIGGFGPLFSGAIILCLLSLVIISTAERQNIILKNPYVSVKFLVFVLILISVLINPESWWARYVPQLWLIPIFSLLFSTNKKNKLLEYTSYFLIFTLIINILMVSSVYLGFQFIGTGVLNKQLDYLSSSNQPEDIYSVNDKKTKIDFNIASETIYLIEQRMEHKETTASDYTSFLNKKVDYLLSSNRPNNLSSLENKTIKVDFNQFAANRIRLAERGIEYDEVHNLNLTQSFDLFESKTRVYIIDR